MPVSIITPAAPKQLLVIGAGTLGADFAGLFLGADASNASVDTFTEAAATPPALRLRAGDSALTTAPGAGVLISGGDGDDSDGGDVTIEGGAGDTSGNGGDVSINAGGNGGGSGAGGAVRLGTNTNTTAIVSGSTATPWTHNGDLDVTGSINGAVAVYKPADEAVASSTVLQDDDHLSLALGVGTYLIDLTARVTLGAGDVGILYTLEGSGGLTAGNVSLLAKVYDVGSNTLKRAEGGDSLGLNWGLSTGAGEDGLFVQITGSIEVTVAGTLRFRWCQGASDAGATTVKRGAFLRATKIA